MMRLAFVGCLFLVAAISADMPEFHATYSMTGTPGKDCFFKVPRTKAEAEAANWLIPPETENITTYQTYCKPDDAKIGAICILIDRMNSSAGYQISVPHEVKNLNISRIDYVKKGYKELTLFNNKWYSNQIWFERLETLLEGGRSFNNQTGEGLWLQAGDVLTETPFLESQMNKTKFHKQACFVRMGQHYFWDIRPNQEPEEFMPWFLLFNSNGDLIGFGHIAFGSKIDPDFFKNYKWFEPVPAFALLGIAPDLPPWVLQYLEKYGIISHHMYFSRNPWDITCENESNLKEY